MLAIGPKLLAAFTATGLLLGSAPTTAPGAQASPAADPAVRLAGLTNGVSLNGVSFNGVSLNGVSFNGVALNGVVLNGVVLNGVVLNGVVLNGVVLNGIALNIHENQGRSASGGEIADLGAVRIRAVRLAGRVAEAAPR